MPAQRSVFGSARVLAVCTLLSRVTGLIRDMLLSQVFGLGHVADAFNFAFQIPNLFRRLFGEGALAAAFVPEFTRTLENHGRPAAWQMLARVLALMTVTITLLLLVLFAALALFAWRGPGETPADLAANRLLIGLTAVMLPFMLTVCVAALLSSVLNCVGSFGPGALLPIILNLGMVAGIVVLGPWFGSAPEQRVYGVAWSVTLAGLLQIALLVPVLRRWDVPLGWQLETRDPNVRRVVALMGPVLLGQGVLVISPFIDSQLCWLLARVEGGEPTARWFGFSFTLPLETGALSAITNAQRLYQFPLGVFAISLATAALPTFTRLANANDHAGWAREFTRTFRMSLFLGLLTGAMMIVWSTPIVRLLFEYRRFDGDDTRRVADVMLWYGLGLWAFCCQHIVVRGFYSVGNIVTPLKLSCGVLPLSIVIALLLVWIPGVRESAFAIGTTVASTVNVLAGLVILQRQRRVALLDAALLAAAARMLVAVGLAIAALLTLQSLGAADFAGRFQPAWLGRVLETGLGLALGSAVYLLAARVLGLSEARDLLRLRRRK